MYGGGGGGGWGGVRDRGNDDASRMTLLNTFTWLPTPSNPKPPVSLNLVAVITEIKPQEGPYKPSLAPPYSV